jgi:hypothetical protein
MPIPQNYNYKSKKILLVKKVQGVILERAIKFYIFYKLLILL